LVDRSHICTDRVLAESLRAAHGHEGTETAVLAAIFAKRRPALEQNWANKLLVVRNDCLKSETLGICPSIAMNWGKKVH
jgi:hypothetical protein